MKMKKKMERKMKKVKKIFEAEETSGPEASRLRLRVSARPQAGLVPG
jgi:hypothetical protein